MTLGCSNPPNDIQFIIIFEPSLEINNHYYYCQHSNEFHRLNIAVVVVVAAIVVVIAVVTATVMAAMFVDNTQMHYLTYLKTTMMLQHAVSPTIPITTFSQLFSIVLFLPLHHCY